MFFLQTIINLYVLESGSEVLSGIPKIVERILRKVHSSSKCAEACEVKLPHCLMWQYNKKSKECKIANLKSKFNN